MTECHECNSEISEDEAYCPFCGIALTLVVSKDSEEEPPEVEEDSTTISGEEIEEDEFDTGFGDAETVVGSLPVVSDQLKDEEAESEFVDVSSLKSEEIPDNEPEVIAKSEKTNEDEPMTTSAITDEEESEEEPDVLSASENETPIDTTDAIEEEVIAAPEVATDEVKAGAADFQKETKTEEPSEEINEITDTEDSVQDSESEIDAEDVIEPVAETEIEDTGVSTELSEKDIPIDAEPAMEIEIPESASIEDVEAVGETLSDRVDAEEIVSSSADIAEDPDFSETIPYISADIGEMKIADPVEDVVEAKMVEESSPADQELQSEHPTKLETPSTPMDVQVETSKTEDDEVDELDESAKLETPTPDLSGENPVSEEDIEADAKPYTTPNIGVEDTDGSNKTKLKPLVEGTVLNDRYEIVRRIGGGGMGAVYLANDKNLGGVLRAVKEMVQSYIEEEQQDKAINDFKRESMLLTTLEHAAIPTIYDYFFDDKESRFYLVMKYISGGDLSGRLRAAPEGKLDERTVVEWGIEVADVLDYLHNHEPPIVYRDLKPANVMVDGNTGRVMLIDFGIARWVNKEEKGVTAVGTMGYAPPELFSGNVEPRSDIYSLGSTMFHLLTGADPQSNPLLIFDFDKNPRPRQINSSLSDGIEQILMKSVEYNADGRFSSSAEMRDVLVEHLRNLIAGKVTYGISETPAPVSLADQSVFCGFCGQKIVATDMFCAFCGAKQPLAQPGVQSQAYVPPQATAKLFIQGTSDLNAPTFDIEKKENLVGRRDPMSNIFPEVDLSKFDPQTKISRKHARIWRDGEKFMLEDLGSSNGTILESGMNGETRLNPKEPRQLSSGDIIRLGDTVLHFVVG